MDYIRAVEVLHDHIKFQNDKLWHGHEFRSGYRRSLLTAFRTKTVKTHAIRFWREQTASWEGDFIMELDMQDIEYFLAKYEAKAKAQEAEKKREAIILEEARLEDTKNSLDRKRRELKALTGKV